MGFFLNFENAVSYKALVTLAALILKFMFKPHTGS